MEQQRRSLVELKEQLVELFSNQTSETNSAVPLSKLPSLISAYELKNQRVLLGADEKIALEEWIQQQKAQTESEIMIGVEELMAMASGVTEEQDPHQTSVVASPEPSKKSATNFNIGFNSTPQQYSTFLNTPKTSVSHLSTSSRPGALVVDYLGATVESSAIDEGFDADGAVVKIRAATKASSVRDIDLVQLPSLTRKLDESVRFIPSFRR